MRFGKGIITIIAACIREGKAGKAARAVIVKAALNVLSDNIKKVYVNASKSKQLVNKFYVFFFGPNCKSFSTFPGKGKKNAIIPLLYSHEEVVRWSCIPVSMSHDPL